MGEIKRVAVFCGSTSGGEVYENSAYLLGKALAEKGIGLVYGGGASGLMGCVARGAFENGGSVAGVIPKFLAELRRVDIGRYETEIIVTADMHERKNRMSAMSDAFIALPGGIGTFEEILEQMTWLQLRLHDKPCAFLNVEGFYDKLRDFLVSTVDAGFLRREVFDSLIFEEDIESLLLKVSSAEIHLPPKIG